MPVEITRAYPNRLPTLASLFGRTFVDEPMMRWPLGVHGDVDRRRRAPPRRLLGVGRVEVAGRARLAPRLGGGRARLPGAGIGAALIDHGLELARADGKPAFLETGTPGNVAYYERRGFRTVSDADAPEGGPHIWFMRRDPA